MSNANGYVPIEPTKLNVQETMEAYDNLPPEYRALLRDAPFNLNLHCVRGTVSDYAETIALVQLEATYVTYGENHPDLVGVE